LSLDLDGIKDLTQLGQYLKNIREERNISIEEIHKETKIRKRYLTAIEEGNFSAIPGGDVYVRGFLRNYSISVGIQASAVIELYDKLKSTHKEEKNLPMFSNTDSVQIDVFSSKFYSFFERNYKRVAAIILTGLLLVVLIMSIRALIDKSIQGNMESQPETPTTQATAPELQDDYQVENIPIDDNKSVMVEIVEDTAHNTIFIIDDEQIEVTMDDIIDRCWISVQKDGQFDFEGILNPGDAKTWEAKDAINMRIGNPPAVNLIVNGNDLGRPRAGARDFIFKKRT
jgi:hypothetical protein